MKMKYRAICKLGNAEIVNTTVFAHDELDADNLLDNIATRIITSDLIKKFGLPTKSIQHIKQEKPTGTWEYTLAAKFL